MTKQKILNLIKTTYEQTVDVRYIDRDFDLQGCDKEKAIKFVYELVDDGELMFFGKHRYITPVKNGFIKGTICGTDKGYAFLQIDGGSGRADDLFITPRDLNGALHCDTVLAKKKELTAKDGAVVFKIVRRGMPNIVGTFKKLKGFGIVTPDERRLDLQVFIKQENSKNAQTGEKVYVNITDYNNDRGRVEGKVAEVLGSPDFKGVDILSVIRSKNLFEEFSTDVLRAADDMPLSVDISTYKDRKIFENCGVVTIDGEDARDFDDAIHIKQEGKNIRLFVHIADVAEYVKEGSVLDNEAIKRGTSVYFPDRVLPMLPKKLSNGICSLNPNVFRLALTAELLFDKNAGVIDGKIYESIIKSEARLTYTEVTKMLNKGEAAAGREYLIPQLKLMADLAGKIEAMRHARGAIDFDMAEAYIKVDEQGKTSEIVRRPREVSHRLIESFMIAANEFVAEKFFALELPFIYRVHEKPDLLRVETFVEFVSGFGEVFKIKGELTNKDLQKFLEQIKGKPYENTINKLALRTMQKARYLENCIGHYGLASVFYCHFTSPIRRYPDLAIHRIIKESLHGIIPSSAQRLSELKDFVAFAAATSSQREKLAEEAEREVDDMKKAEYMARFLGEDFDGIISGVQSFGVFVELPNTCEGLVRIDNLAPGTYQFLEKKIMLKGTQKTYKLGDSIKVKVIAASAADKRVEFKEVIIAQKELAE